MPRTLHPVDWLALSLFAATILVWAFIDLGTETQLQWMNETFFIPACGLLMPAAGLVTGGISFLKGREIMQPAFILGACSPVVAIVGFIVGLSIAMGRFEAIIYAGP